MINEIKSDKKIDILLHLLNRIRDQYSMTNQNLIKLQLFAICNRST